MTQNEHVDVVGIGNALDADARAMWLSIGRSMLHQEGTAPRPVLTLVPHASLHPRKHRVGGGLESASPKLIRNTIGS